MNGFDERLSFPGLIPEMRGEEQQYFDYCQDGRLMIQRCTQCGDHVFYPRGACPGCLSNALEWVEADGSGTVFTYTVHHRFPPGFEGSEEYVVAIVELDEGVRMMTRVVCPVEVVAIGMPVSVAFAKIAEGFQVPVFIPARGRDE